MNPKMTQLILAAFLLQGSLVLATENHEHQQQEKSAVEHNDRQHEHNEEEGDHEEAAISLSEQQMRMAAIRLIQVHPEPYYDMVNAPGEIILNRYKTSKVTPRIASQVIKRHVQLGQKVKKGQALVTLSSVDMAEAQSTLMEANVELKRVKKLGKKVVSDKRYIAAQIAFQKAWSRVRAYGMTVRQIRKLLATGDAARATGEYQLLAWQDGTLIADNFVLGEMVEPGHVLMEITDESSLWVEAHLAPEDAVKVKTGGKASVLVDQQWLQGKIIQSRHTINATTRTLAVHVEIKNTADMAHPGEFVSVRLQAGKPHQGIILPLSAVLRSPDGDWQVFVQQQAGVFVPREVEIVQTLGQHLVVSGIEEGESIVTQGAFFINSEMAKSGFAVHNH